MKPTVSTPTPAPSSQKFIWGLACGFSLTLLGFAVFSLQNPKETAEIPPPPTNPDGTPATPILVGAPLPPPIRDKGIYEVAEINGQQVVKFRVNEQGDEVVFDTTTGKVIYIRTKDGLAPSNDYPMPPMPIEMPPMPKAMDETIKTWFQNSSM